MLPIQLLPHYELETVAVRQKNEALDVDMTCAQLFGLLQAPGSFEKLVCLQEQQAWQEMVDLLQQVCLGLSFHIIFIKILILIWLSVLAFRRAIPGSYL